MSASTQVKRVQPVNSGHPVIIFFAVVCSQAMSSNTGQALGRTQGRSS